MKIAHVCLSSHYSVGLTYQENMLTDIHARDGHEVLVVSDCQAYSQGQLVDVPPQDERLSNGIRLVRLPFAWVLSRWISGKIRKATGLAPLLEEFKPDVILFHGVAGWELRTVGAYKRAYPSIRLYLDCHEDIYNSGLNIVSRVLQYKLLTRWLLSSILDQVEKILYVSEESRDFLVTMYQLRDERMEFYPLGGLLIEREAKAEIRRKVRNRLSIAEESLVYIHSGKLDPGKKTLQIIDAFSNLSDTTAILLIAGRIPDDQAAVLNAAIASDSRVKFLGWQNGAELTELMCASDAYLQPGTQSASLQVALCCGLPVIVYPYSSHAPYVQGNGCYVKSSDEIKKWFDTFSQDRDMLKRMSNASYAVARNLLDYNKLAARVYH
jgi:glycosyltransferase involved in cell wall biosynthesis